MKKIDWIGMAWVSPCLRYVVRRISDDREDVMLYVDGEPVKSFSSVGPAMRHAEHLAEQKGSGK